MVLGKLNKLILLDKDLVGEEETVKIHCNKCNKTLTQDLYPINHKYYDTRKVWDTIVVKEIIGGEMSTYSTKTFKRGIFIQQPATKRYNWTVVDMYGCDSKMQVKREEYYCEKDLSYHRVLGGETKKLVVGRLSLLRDIIPPFKSGFGCCDWSNGQELICSCGSNLGEMYLDCYEEGVVKFHESSVRRVYKGTYEN